MQAPATRVEGVGWYSLGRLRQPLRASDTPRSPRRQPRRSQRILLRASRVGGASACAVRPRRLSTIEESRSGNPSQSCSNCRDVVLNVAQAILLQWDVDWIVAGINMRLGAYRGEREGYEWETADPVLEQAMRAFPVAV